MIMMMNQKKVLNQIMGDKPEESESSPLETIMQELMTCLTNGDASGAAQCFQSAVAHCQPQEVQE